MGLYDKAIPALVSAAKALESSDYPDPRLPQVLNALGNMAISTGEGHRAEDFFLRALKSAEKLTPEDKMKTRNTLVHLGLFYSERDRAKEAVPLLERAARISEEGTDRVLFAIDLDNLDLNFERLNLHKKSNTLSLKAVEILDSLPPEKEDVVTRALILYNLAWSYKNQKRYTEAEPLYRKSLYLFENETRGQIQNWQIKTVLKGYANLLRQTNRNDEAVVMESRIKQFRR